MKGAIVTDGDLRFAGTQVKREETASSTAYSKDAQDEASSNLLWHLQPEHSRRPS